jgi:hypothetical protein
MTVRARLVPILPVTVFTLAAATSGSAAVSEPMPQLPRNAELATISKVVVDHDPMARATTVRLALEVETADGMHVNANPPSYQWLIPVEATVTGVDGVHVLDAYYPEATSSEFPYADEPLLVYADTFVIGLVLSLDASMPPGGRELVVVLDFQACNDEACFAPAKTSAKLPVTVVADAADAREITSPILERAPFPR